MTTGGMPIGKREVRELTDAERDAFIADARAGVLVFTGDEAYAVPLGYRYVKGTILLSLPREPGRKWDFINKNRKVCFNIWQYGEHSNVPSLKRQRYSSVIIEGELDEITDDQRSYYELPTKFEGVDLVLFALKANKVGTRTLRYVE
jgi:nitroimidazol reductase NimA-like FMN-containing flavoprotein (pyridoxamine 5'-phosphate oxidase superfamily)